MEIQSGAVRPVGSVQEGWNIIKNDYWTFFLMTLVAGVIVLAAALMLGFVSNLISIAISAALGVTTVNSSDAVKMGVAVVPQLISLVISLFTNIIVGALSGALVCGIYSGLARKASTGVADFGDLFSGFQKFTACLTVATVMAVIQFVISLGFLITGAAVGVSILSFGGLVSRNGQVDWTTLSGVLGVMAIFAIIYIVINLIISALTSFAYPLIADRNLSGGQALSWSVKGGLANLFGMILLMLLTFLMCIGGAMVCLVGILFVVPIVSASFFAAYQSVFGRAQNAFQHTPPPPPTFGSQPGY
jgi:hypothetical protein